MIADGNAPPRPPVRSTLTGSTEITSYCDRVSCQPLASTVTLQNYTLRVGPSASKTRKLYPSQIDPF